MSFGSCIAVIPTGARCVCHGIDIWLAHYDNIDDQQLAAMRTLLSEYEQVQEQRFHFSDDRKRYLVTRAMVRTVLSRYAQVDPAQWQFTTNAYGRPEIAALHEEATGLRFNVSHTRSLIALGITRQRELGIDVECLGDRRVSLGVADHVFAREELAALRAVPPAGQSARFLEYWTFKEAYVKARGMGLSIPLDKFNFHFPDAHTVTFSTDPTLNDDPGRWAFWQFSPTPKHLLAVCAERLGRDELSIGFRLFTPTTMDIPTEIVCRKRSDSRDYHSSDLCKKHGIAFPLT